MFNFKNKSTMSPKMKERNVQLKKNLGAIASKEAIKEIKSIPKEDTVNRQGFKAYSLPDELRLLTMLNTLKLKDQYYRSEDETMVELRDLIERLDPYFVCQAIIYSRCMGEGMRTINHLGAALVAPLISGEEWAKRFFYSFDKKNKKGGCIFRPDDMSEIKDAWFALGAKGLPSSMRNGFAHNLETYDTYSLAKYKKSVIDIANLAHPNSKLSKAEMTDEDGLVKKVLDLIMQGKSVIADTWEAAQSEAGQEVAKAVREGKLSQAEAEKVLAEAKTDNWDALLKEGKLGILAALRNIRNIMKNPRKEIIDMWCALISNQDMIRKNLILPIHFDLAYDVVKREFSTYDYAHQVMGALQDAYIKSIPNLAQVFTGKTCIIVDCSGSMGMCISDGKKLVQSDGWWRSTNETDRCCYKAGLIAATIAKACDADVVKFGTMAQFFEFNKHQNVFELAKKIGTCEYGGTSPYKAWQLITQYGKKYDRIIFISDNEVNSYNLTSDYYKNYLRICSPYVYAIDLAAYGTTPLAGDKVAYFYGYGASLYEDLTKNEFNPSAVIDKVKQIVI